MKPLAIGTVTLAIALGAHGAAHPQTIEKKALNLEGAKKVIAAAIAEAKSKNAPGGAIAVVDEGGNLIAVERWTTPSPPARIFRSAKLEPPHCSNVRHNFSKK